MRNIVCIILIILCFNAQAQKKELRKIDKLILESFFDEAKDELQNAKSLILSSEDKYKVQYYFYDSKVSNELKEFENAINSLNSLNKVTGRFKKIISSNINLRQIPQLIFKIDETFEYAKKINDILDKIKK